MGREKEGSTIFASSASICEKLLCLSFVGSVVGQCHLLNFVEMTGHFFAKNPCEIRIMRNDHVSIVFLVIVVLPAFVPPAKADEGFQFPRDNFGYCAPRPIRGVPAPVVQIAIKLCNNNWL